MALPFERETNAGGNTSLDPHAATNGRPSLPCSTTGHDIEPGSLRTPDTPLHPDCCPSPGEGQCLT
eukprot:5680681-Pyramimonas_sp.AAC.1